LCGTEVSELTLAPFRDQAMPIPILVVLSISVAVSGNHPTREAMKWFRGHWVCVYVETEGVPIPKEGIEDLKHLDILVEGDRITLIEEGKVREEWDIHYKVDPTKKPWTIDIAVSLEGTKPKTLLGIYKVDGDTLKISIVGPKKEPERATEFVTRPGSNNLLWHFKRK
jgi:uncharacterized protein (TIGR03067 family)